VQSVTLILVARKRSGPVLKTPEPGTRSAFYVTW